MHQESGFPQVLMINQNKNKAIAKDLLKGFYQFLTCAKSRHKDEWSAKQSQSRIMKILRVVDQDMDVQILVNRHLLREIIL